MDHLHHIFDTVVLGAGINGSWTAYHLTKNGAKTVLIEKFPLGHSRGSSHGHSRATRRTYEEDFLCKVMPDAYKQWDQLEMDSKEMLFK